MKNAFAFLLLLTISAFAQTSRVIPQGTEIKVRTDSAIPAKPAAGSAYSATVSQDVQDSSGAVVIPHGSPARLVAVKNGNDTTLDLRSVTIDGRRYSITSARENPLRVDWEPTSARRNTLEAGPQSEPSWVLCLGEVRERPSEPL